MMKELKRVIELLASDPEHQIKYLEQLGVAPVADELGLEFDDVKNLKQELPSEIKNILSILDKKLDSMGGADNSELWRIQALPSAKEWQEVRQLAKEALSLLG